MVKVKRAYEAPSARDGQRFLVERLWPRGVRKEDLPLAAWVKDAAPAMPATNSKMRTWMTASARSVLELPGMVAVMGYHRPIAPRQIAG